jgi:chromosomal replication initiator protein
MENNGFSGSKPYTVRFPGKSKYESTNRPVSIPFDNENSIKNPFIIPGIKKLHIDPQLCPDKTFSNFVEGDCNRLARSAGLAVANNPGGTAFNPLFYYSENGLGKTHLGQAIGLEVKEKYPEKRYYMLMPINFQISLSNQSGTITVMTSFIFTR